MPLPQSYDSKISEKKLQEQWLASGVYTFRDDQPRAKTFIIDTPPPTVSGLLHMGHIFSYTQADFVARYQRMSGKDVCYPMGFDDNGLPTERLVEKIKGVRGSSMPRAEFIALCKDVVDEAEEEFRKLFKSVALSVDWGREYQTISPRVRALSQASFLDLLGKEEAYRDFRPTYWDWVDQTAIAQAEIENKEMPGVMHEIVFALEGSAEALVIATTRPELLGACVAVMYHPEDPNADKYKDKHAVTPLFGVKVPMIADELVERDKGTGLVMCCTFGDDTDKEWQRKHVLPRRTILDLDGKARVAYLGDTEKRTAITFKAGIDGKKEVSALDAQNCINISQCIATFEQIEGLKPKQAQAKIVELLEAAGAMLKKTPITHTVKCAERSGTPIEIIPTYQWFVRIADKKEELKAKGADCNWYPEYMRIRLDQWIEGLKEDWCISRQRFFGVPFPVWYSKRAGEEGKILVPDAAQLPVDPMVDLPAGYSADEVTPDKDVMDTWATSSISPQINAQTLESCKLFPADLRPQAHEIIRTWAFYTIVKAHLHTGTIPWKNVMISGWCLAADKTKMSKSKGNVVTPVALIEEKGADAVRYWASTSRLGSDTAFSEDLLKIGKKLVNKIWNASQLVARVLEQDSASSIQDSQSVNVYTEALDRWILTRLHRTIQKATEAFEQFEYADARAVIEDFFWNDFCDNYLELVKGRAYGELSAVSCQLTDSSKTDNRQPTTGQQSAKYALHTCLDATLRLFAPFVPHVTEEIYSHLFAKEGESVHARGQWPKASQYPVDASAEAAGMAAVEILNIIRKTKSEANVSIKFPVKEVVIARASDAAPQKATLEAILQDVCNAGNAENIRFVEKAADGAVLSEDGNFLIFVQLGEAQAA